MKKRKIKLRKNKNTSMQQPSMNLPKDFGFLLMNEILGRSPVLVVWQHHTLMDSSKATQEE
jgi:hypothetical protein